MNNRVKEIFRNIPIMAILAAILLTACGAEQGIEAHKVWMRPAAQDENEAVYFMIHNHASQADELISVSSDAAQAVELDESRIVSGVTEMKKLDSLPVEAFAEIEFAPGSYHVMLIWLKQDLNVGDGIEITLHFKNHADLPIKVSVQNILLPEHEGHQPPSVCEIEKVGYNASYLVFLKHWLIEKMPPTARTGLVFIDDSQGHGSLSAMVNEFSAWGQAFAPAPVGFQYGYQSDKSWWSSLSDPPRDIGNVLLAAIPNTRDLIWVDFTAYDIWPPE